MCPQGYSIHFYIRKSYSHSWIKLLDSTPLFSSLLFSVMSLSFHICMNWNVLFFSRLPGHVVNIFDMISNIIKSWVRKVQKQRGNIKIKHNFFQQKNVNTQKLRHDLSISFLFVNCCIRFNYCKLIIFVQKCITKYRIESELYLHRIYFTPYKTNFMIHTPNTMTSMDSRSTGFLRGFNSWVFVVYAWFFFSFPLWLRGFCFFNHVHQWEKDNKCTVWVTLVIPKLGITNVYSLCCSFILWNESPYGIWENMNGIILCT